MYAVEGVLGPLAIGPVPHVKPRDAPRVGAVPATRSVRAIAVAQDRTKGQFQIKRRGEGVGSGVHPTRPALRVGIVRARRKRDASRRVGSARNRTRDRRRRYEATYPLVRVRFVRRGFSSTSPLVLIHEPNLESPLEHATPHVVVVEHPPELPGRARERAQLSLGLHVPRDDPPRVLRQRHPNREAPEPMEQNQPRRNRTVR